MTGRKWRNTSARSEPCVALLFTIYLPYAHDRVRVCWRSIDMILCYFGFLGDLFLFRPSSVGRVGRKGGGLPSLMIGYSALIKSVNCDVYRHLFTITSAANCTNPVVYTFFGIYFLFRPCMKHGVPEVKYAPLTRTGYIKPGNISALHVPPEEEPRNMAIDSLYLTLISFFA